MTTWHITFGTYGTRLHGEARPTVEREHNHPGEPFVKEDPVRARAERDRMVRDPVIFNAGQCEHIERVLPDICSRGRWTYRIAAAPPEGDHVHILLASDPERHGKQIRRWLKQWLTESLNAHWPRDTRWWAHGGSGKPVKDPSYLRNVTRYIARQRTLALTDREIMV